ncbi:MAG: polysaccharide deacetylase family protein [Phycisphaerae bacterium]
MTSAIAIVGVAITAMLLFHIALPRTARWRQVWRMRRRFRNRIALTFDDGPDEVTTPLVLDLLKRFDTTASFFIVGFRADRHPEIVDRIVAEGHEVGCHSYWHRNFWRRWPWTGVADLTHAFSAMSRWMPPDAPYRPPFGILTG